MAAGVSLGPGTVAAELKIVASVISPRGCRICVAHQATASGVWTMRARARERRLSAGAAVNLDWKIRGVGESTATTGRSDSGSPDHRRRRRLADERTHDIGVAIARWRHELAHRWTRRASARYARRWRVHVEHSERVS